jgi:hypothetical protein
MLPPNFTVQLILRNGFTSMLLDRIVKIVLFSPFEPRAHLFPFDWATATLQYKYLLS